MPSANSTTSNLSGSGKLVRPASCQSSWRTSTPAALCRKFRLMVSSTSVMLSLATALRAPRRKAATEGSAAAPAPSSMTSLPRSPIGEPSQAHARSSHSASSRPPDQRRAPVPPPSGRRSARRTARAPSSSALPCPRRISRTPSSPRSSSGSSDCSAFVSWFTASTPSAGRAGRTAACGNFVEKRCMAISSSFSKKSSTRCTPP
mmetsp:Transcript_54603/g.147238  ORF Transcript_54603/g.147238 Transcript_54603/m.147238 type:complete len:204 (-) Transcript_54603:171-782(-)